MSLKNFRTFEDGSSGVFCNVIEVLYCASAFEKLSVKARFDASVMLDDVIRYQDVLIAITYLRITEITSALLKYLQTSGLDFFYAFNMVVANSQTTKICPQVTGRNFKAFAPSSKHKSK